MPVAAVALAATSFATAASAFAVSATLMSGLTMVGSALSIVGTISGNSKLSALGGVLSLGAGAAGGWGQAAAGEAAAASGATVADAAQTAAAGDALAGNLAATPGVTVGGAANLGSGMSQLGGADGTSLFTQAKNAGQMPIATDVATADANLINGAQAPQTFQQPIAPKPFGAQAQQALTDATLNPGTMQTPTTALGNGAFDGSMSRADALKAADGMATSQASGGSLMQQAMAWAQKNPELAKVALQTGGAFAGNLFPSDKDKQMAAYYKQATADQQRKALWAQGRTA